MTYTPAKFGVINTEGIDFTATYNAYDQTAVSSDTNTPVYPGPPFIPGERANGSNGTEYVFVKAAEALTAYAAVGISETAYNASLLTKAMADAGREIAVAQTAIASGYYGWVQSKGAMSCQLKNACLPSVPLYTTASAGMLDDTSASQTRVYGIRSTQTSTSSGSAKICWVQNLVT